MPWFHVKLLHEHAAILAGFPTYIGKTATTLVKLFCLFLVLYFVALYYFCLPPCGEISK